MAKRRPGAAAAAYLADADRPSDPEPDPLAGLPPTGDADIEAESDAEADAIQAGFRDRMRRENDRFRRATDTEHWVAVCFVTREDKESFLEQTGGPDLGDKYIDGHAWAARLGIQLRKEPAP